MSTGGNSPRQAAGFEALLAPVLDRAYGLAYHLARGRDEAEDLVQEASLQAFSHFDQFQPGTNFKAWYFRILTNCFLMRYRRRRREPEILNLEDAEPLFLHLRAYEAGLVGPPDDPAALVLSKVSAEQVHEAIAALPGEFRVVCALYFVEDLPYREIAQALGCPVGTVRSRLHRGRRMLQKALWHLAVEQGIVPAAPAARERRSS